MKTNNFNKALQDALMKKALGYDAVESVDEYASDPFISEMRVVKRKVTKKYVPPDLNAAKILVELSQNGIANLNDMTDQQLEQERQKLLKLLTENIGEKTDENFEQM